MMIDRVTMKNADVGSVAVVSRQAFEKNWQHKGWVEVDPSAITDTGHDPDSAAGTDTTEGE